MTKQETFDTVASHLMQQAEQCSDGEGNCLYRDDKGRMCAAGCLIPDAAYSPKLEHWSVFQPCDAGPSEAGVLLNSIGHDLSLLAALQDAHDNYTEDVWPKTLRSIAEKHGLSAAVVDDLEPYFNERRKLLSGGQG